MAAYCNEQRLYSRVLDGDNDGEWRPTWKVAFCLRDRPAAYRLAEEETIDMPTPPSTVTQTLCGGHRRYHRLTCDVIQTAPVDMERQACQSHRLYRALAEGEAYRLQSAARARWQPAYSCGEAQGRSLPGGQASLWSHAAHVPMHTAHVNATVPRGHGSHICSEHRRHNGREDDDVNMSPVAAPPDVPLAGCSEHRATRGCPHTLTSAEDPDCPCALTASMVVDGCYGPFAASAGTEQFVQAMSGQEVALGQASARLEDTFVWYAVVAKTSGNLVHTRFVQHIWQHACVVGTQVFARSGDYVKGMDTGAPDLVAVVRMTAESYDEVQEVAALLLSTVAVPLTESKHGGLPEKAPRSPSPVSLSVVD